MSGDKDLGTWVQEEAFRADERTTILSSQEPISLASSRYRHDTDHLLCLFGVSQLFDVVVQGGKFQGPR